MFYGRVFGEPEAPAVRCTLVASQLWWENQSTRVVIIIHITFKPDKKSLLVEAWRMIDNSGGRLTRQTPPRVPAATSSITIDDQGVIVPHDGELRIPYECVFDVTPPVGVVDIVLSSAELQVLGQHTYLQIPPVSWLDLVGSW